MRIALVGLFLGMTLTCAAASSAAAPASTRIHYFHGFRHGRIAPWIHVTRTVRLRGDCMPSQVESRHYAWECDSAYGSFGADPCFSTTVRRDPVLCPVRIWSRKVIRVRVAGRQWKWVGWPRYAVTRHTPPIGLWTTTGKRCTFFNGAGNPVDGERANYMCDRGGLLVGRIDRRTTMWTESYAAGWRAHKMQPVGITDAWW